jgi:hypothetical protein
MFPASSALIPRRRKCSRFSIYSASFIIRVFPSVGGASYVVLYRIGQIVQAYIESILRMTGHTLLGNTVDI